MPIVHSLLIANRGEIAVRVIRAAKELGMRTIAVYSELDRNAVHVTLADEAWNIGPAPAAESYLGVNQLLKIATESGADAVHPGYGFLAENAKFATAVTNAGLIWVGPPPSAIATMGDKIASRSAAARAGVASVPGTNEPTMTATEVLQFSEKHGYPIAIKAAHGGGGRGLKVVQNDAEIETAFRSAQRESEAWFGSSEVYIERYLNHPRHIEAQILIDNHGNASYLGERDCSVQRRHQKLIEEAPALGLSNKQRQEIGEAALAIASMAEYRNAGTVEFLLDTDGSFYFLEMNTRIQVEHTVTEMVTGIDLVKEQLRVAAGDPLSFETPVPIHGHAIEFRINAEDVTANFLPSQGQITGYREPAGLGVRVDSGVDAGSIVSQYYDNLIAKLIVWGRDREEALARSKTALEQFQITGIETTIPAHLHILKLPKFRSADRSTKWLEEEINFNELPQTPSSAISEDDETEERSMTVEVGGRRYVVRFWAPVIPQPNAAGQDSPRRKPPKLARSASAVETSGIVIAPMQGTIVKVHKSAGSKVSAGEPIAVLEAMKMESEITSPNDGEIVDLRVQPGDTVTNGAVIMIIR